MGGVEQMKMSYSFGVFVLKDLGEKQKIINSNVIKNLCLGKGVDFSLPN